MIEYSLGTIRQTQDCWEQKIDAQWEDGDGYTSWRGIIAVRGLDSKTAEARAKEIVELLNSEKCQFRLRLKGRDVF